MLSNEERTQRVGKKALEYDRDYAGCSQSVLGALQEEFGIGNKESFRAASVLSGGIARQGETCGAIIGALLALGLVMGREKIEDVEPYQAIFKPSAEIRAKFMAELKKQYGFKGDLKSTLCRSVQKKVLGRSYNMADEQDHQAFIDDGGRTDTKCPKVCAVAAQVAAEKILELI